MKLCPCCSGKNYAGCCGLFISNKQFPRTPEELMRSRYTAYTEANLDYIARTMRSPAADHFDAEEAREWAQKVKWLELEVLASQVDGTKGSVEFKAHYSYQGQKHCLHELSKFCLENEQWYYCKGVTPQSHPERRTTVKTPRNDPCPCGSNKKYKKCCGAAG